MNTTREFLNTCKEVCGSESPNKQMEQIIISPRSKKLIRVLRHLHLGTSRKLEKVTAAMIRIYPGMFLKSKFMTRFYCVKIESITR